MKSIEIKLELRDLGDRKGRNEVTEFKEWLEAELQICKDDIVELNKELEDEPWVYSGEYENMYAMFQDDIEELTICIDALDSGVRPEKTTIFGDNILDMYFAIYYNHGGRSDRK